MGSASTHSARQRATVPRAAAVRPQRRGSHHAGPDRRLRWVIGDHEVASRGHSECVLSLGVQTGAHVADVVERAHRAGAKIVTEPGQQPWGYAGAFADPDGHIWMVTSETPQN